MSPEVALSLSIIGIFLNLFLGLIVIMTSARRLPNVAFLFLAIVGSLWLTFLALTFIATTEPRALSSMRIASILGCLVPIAFRQLRLAVLHPEESFFNLFRHSRFQLVAFVGVAIYCLTPLYVKGVSFPGSGVPNVINGPLPIIFPIYFLGLIFNEIYQLKKAIGNTGGIRRYELQFILTGVIILLVVGVLMAVVAPLIAKNSQPVVYSPIWIFLTDATIAYGIVTKRILNVGVVVRKMISFVLLIAYIGACYAGIYWITSHLFGEAMAAGMLSGPAICATLAVALSIGRAQNVLNFFLDRAFQTTDQIDLRNCLFLADRELSKVTTTDDLLERFTDLLNRTARTERSEVQLFESNAENPFPAVRQLLRNSQEPLLASSLARRNHGDATNEALKAMRTNEWELAIGIYTEGVLGGIVFLAERLSGRVYTEAEQDSLQLLVTRFSNALENAALYTQVANSDIYNQKLLNHLVNGVVAADTDEAITVINPEARRILNLLDPDKPLHLNDLPHEVADAARKLLVGKSIEKESEVDWTTEEEEHRVVRMDGTPLTNQDTEVVGVLLVLNDISAERQLENHVRHSDRLATIGKVSASMAHEIKNPLVAIKSFAQLLPERMDDTKFLSKFSEIVEGEVNRISDAITGLLSYARVDQSDFEEIHVHEIIHASVDLLGPEFRKKRLNTELVLNAPSDLALGHSGQIKQIFVNLLLNAYEAVDNNGHITITTRLLDGEGNRLMNGSERTHGRVIEVALQDTGCGISQEDAKHIFMPFFTTKKRGTGLGLALTSNLISNHQGTIALDSEPSQGTTVFVRLPLASRDKKLEPEHV